MSFTQAGTASNKVVIDLARKRALKEATAALEKQPKVVDLNAPVASRPGFLTTALRDVLAQKTAERELKDAQEREIAIKEAEQCFYRVVRMLRELKKNDAEVDALLIQNVSVIKVIGE